MKCIDMNQIRAKARTFMACTHNCMIINKYRSHAGLEGMS